MRITLALGILFLASPLVAQSSFPIPASQIPPIYPPAAQAVRASGIVIVHVEIDEAGAVVGATSTGGHPLLRKAAEKAAGQWIFLRTPGRHFISLTFAFSPGKYGATNRVVRHGPYKLELIAGLAKILQSRSH